MRPKRTIGILTPFYGGYYLGNVIMSIQNELSRFGDDLVVIRTAFRDMDDLVASAHVDGWIVITHAVSDEMIRRLAATGKPLVAIAYDISQVDGPIIMADNTSGMMQTIEHLIRHGHEHIAIVGDYNMIDLNERVNGYIKALEKHGIPVRKHYIMHTDDIGEGGGRQAVDLIMEQKLPCTAIACCTDMIALGAIARLDTLGKRVPDDVAVTGYDNSTVARSVDNAITSVDQNLLDLGKEALYTLMGIINGNPHPGGIIYVSNSLHVRSSCGCAHDVEADRYLDLIDTDMLGERMEIHYEFYQFMITGKKFSLEEFGRFVDNQFLTGCLSKWSRQADSDELELTIVQAHRFDRKGTPPLASSLQPAMFPPSELYSDTGESHMTYIFPIRVGSRETGMLSMSARYSAICSREGYSRAIRYLDLLSFALERELIMDELVNQAERYRGIAEQLEIVSRTTNDGIWDWHLHTGIMTCNERFFMLLDITPLKGDLTMAYDTFVQFIHPEDRGLFLSNIELHTQLARPFHCEFRLQPPGEAIVWIEASGDSIRGENNEPLRMIGSVRDISGRKQHEQQMQYMAYHDSLTGLINRMRLHELIGQYIDKQTPFALLLLDLDGFKPINDAYGHQTGDKLLQLVSSDLNRVAPEEDHAARYGGDEFVVVYPSSGVDDITAFAKQVTGALKGVILPSQPTIRIGASIGISVYPEHGDDADTLLRYADIAMYTVKQQGKSGFRWYSA